MSKCLVCERLVGGENEITSIHDDCWGEAKKRISRTWQPITKPPDNSDRVVVRMDLAGQYYYDVYGYVVGRWYNSAGTQIILSEHCEWMAL